MPARSLPQRRTRPEETRQQLYKDAPEAASRALADAMIEEHITSKRGKALTTVLSYWCGSMRKSSSSRTAPKAKAASVITSLKASPDLSLQRKFSTARARRTKSNNRIPASLRLTVPRPSLRKVKMTPRSRTLRTQVTRVTGAWTRVPSPSRCRVSSRACRTCSRCSRSRAPAPFNY